MSATPSTRSTSIVERLRGAALDKDNMPRMLSERWLPVGLGLEAADEIERLRAACERMMVGGKGG